MTLSESPTDLVSITYVADVSEATTNGVSYTTLDGLDQPASPALGDVILTSTTSPLNETDETDGGSGYQRFRYA